MNTFLLYDRHQQSIRIKKAQEMNIFSVCVNPEIKLCVTKIFKLVTFIDFTVIVYKSPFFEALLKLIHVGLISNLSDDLLKLGFLDG